MTKEHGKKGVINLNLSNVMLNIQIQVIPTANPTACVQRKERKDILHLTP